MRLYRASDREDLYHKIYVYKQRREELKEEYKGSWKEKRIMTATINKSIKLWSKRMANIDQRNAQIIGIANGLCYFSGINIKNSARKKTKEYKINRAIFAKYCLEKGLRECLLDEYIGTCRGSLSRARRVFTASFETNPVNRELYNRFKIYMEFLEEEAIINQQNSV